MSERKGFDGRVFVCQPTYGIGHPESHKQFWVATHRPDGKGLLGTEAQNQCHWGESILTKTFNALWCTALNLRDAGEPIQFFAMLHQDILPQAGWLDILLAELLAHDADVMSALVPIKDAKGCTSTAIEDPADLFGVERRLTQTEAVNLLPPTFAIEDTGYDDGRALLVNTGCWICRFDRPWVDAQNPDGSKKVFFTIHDKIIKENGRWVECVAPEDWNFSRMVHALGGKVMCTRKVSLSHVGMMPFPNQTAWGLPQDPHWDHKHKGRKIGKPERAHHDASAAG